MHRSRQGFTLVEVIVAMMLLLIAISGVYAAMLTALTSFGSNEQLTSRISLPEIWPIPSRIT